MSQQCSWPTHSWPLEGRCPYYALLGLTQAPGLAGGPDFTSGSQFNSFMTHILLSTMLMSISRLHLGQNKGKFKRVVSFRTLILVRQWHTGHRIHSDFRLVIDAKSHQLLATTNTSFFDSRTYLPQYAKCFPFIV